MKGRNYDKFKKEIREWGGGGGGEEEWNRDILTYSHTII
jgi:hypothetical protein